MALNPSTNGVMSGRITAPDANYPFGSSKDETSAGAGDGTPYFKARADDIFGFQQALLTEASIVPNGNAETAISSQYLDSLRVLSQLPYSPLMGEYPVGARVVGGDGNLYQCLIANGIDSTVVDPVGDTTGTWKASAVSYAKITDTKAPTVAGGTFTSGAWQTRTLNTKDSDDDLIVTLAANQLTLQAGSYRVKASAPGYEVGGHKIRLRNITDGATEIVGSSAYINPTINAMTHSFLSDEFTITSAKTFELQHHCQTTDGSGFGVDLGGGGENAVYATIEIWRL